MTTLRLAALLCSTLSLVACRGEHRDTQVPAGEGDASGAHAEPVGYPGELIPTQEFGAGFMARQKLAGRFGEREFAFGAVLQLHEDTLTVLGLTPFGTKAFVLTQTGTQVEFESLIDREIPFPPEYILQDIQRALLWHARLPWGGSPPQTPTAEVEVAGERVSETWGESGLERRTFERLDQTPAGTIVVEYIGGHTPERPAKRIVLTNGWFGYEIEIETTDWRKI